MLAALMIFEPLRPEHDEAVAELTRVCFGDAPKPGDIGARRERDVAEAWVARDGEAIVAFAFLLVVCDEAELHTVGVDPARRREGIARALVERASAAVRERGAARIFLEVSRNNRAAIALYEDMGFTLERVRARYYPDGSDALVMARAL